MTIGLNAHLELRATGWFIPPGPLEPQSLRPDNPKWINGARAQLAALSAQHPALGRPKGISYPTLTSYREAIRTEIYAHPDRLRALSKAQPQLIATWLNIGRATLFRHNRAYSLSLPKIKRQNIG
jgi:hypothetical protein